MAIYPLIALLLATSCHCASVSGGFNFGKSSRWDVTAGGAAKITRDGLALTADGTGVIGGQYQGELHGGLYGNVNGKEFGAQGKVSGGFAGALEPGIHAAFGRNSKGEFPLAFKPSLGLSNSVDFSANGEAAVGDDAHHLRKIFGPPMVDA